MPRRLISAGFATVAALMVLSMAFAPGPARAADPEAAPYLEAATEAGMTCQPPAEDSEGGTHWSCGKTDFDTDRLWSADVDDLEGESFFATVYRSWPDPQPAEPDVLALMDRFITITIGEDEEAREWLVRMNDTGVSRQSLQRGDWELTWFADQVTPADGTYAGIQLSISFRPAPASPSPVPESVTPAASPSQAAGAGGCLADGVSDAWHDITIVGDPGNETVETADLESRLAAAEALAGLDYEGEDDELRDALVDALRADPMDLEAATALGLAAGRFEGSRSGLGCVVGPQAGASPESAPVDGAAGGASGRPFADSVARPEQVSTDPIVVLQSAALAALLVFLMPFPSQLFNSTLESHEDEVRRWFRLDRIGSAVAGIGAFWASWPGVAVFTLVAALLYGFLDPGFGFGLGSLATFLGMLVGIVLVTAAFAVPVVLAHRRLGDRWQLKVVPVSLLIGVACVLLSRLTGFQPGYLYGLLIGLAFARELSATDEGRATAIGALIMLVVAFAAWLGLGALPGGDGFGLVVLRTSLAALMVAGLEGVVFGLLPMRFLPGEPLYAWNRILWGVLLAVGAFAFFHILINPASGYLSDTSRTPLFTVVGLLLGFSLVSVAFWAWFRFRDAASAETGADA